MESQPPPPHSPTEATTTTALNFDGPNLIVDKHSKPNPTLLKRKMKNKKKRKDEQKLQADVVSDPLQRSMNSVSSSSASTSNVSNSRSKGFRLLNNRRNYRVANGSVTQRRNAGEADALALPLGMSIAAFVAQVLEKKDAAGEKMSVDHLSEICTLAVKESLSNVFGDKFDCFVSNFERSFQSTLMTLRVIHESSGNRERSYYNNEGSSNNFDFNIKDNISSSSQEQTTIDDLNVENMHTDPVYNGQQLTCVPPNRLYSGVNQSSIVTTFERSVSEQARSNDLKEFKIGLMMKKMKLKEAQIAVECDSNVLERFKLSMGITKAKFKAEKFKTELEDSRHTQLLKKCADFLVAGLLIMLTGLGYGTYIHSHQRLAEATESCIPIKESSSWWKPMASFSSGFQILRCQVQVLSRMLFGLLMIIVITFLLIQRSGTVSQTMPITFLLLLGFGCGFAGKFCVDTLGGSGTHWLIYWELFCLVHFFANIWTSVLFVILNGPVTVTDQSKSRKLFPYWFRRSVFYPAVLVGLPLLCGLMPFAGPFEWFEHFGLVLENLVSE